ncbi:hypothetical protein GCM10022393_35130 [Aquimarina addita]|uniref:Heparan-alpha-glucosaminide N-acetyltransferase catalytic domain-containing protein n=1 Tax=Aquimarina addita TaxID=870485 RepID=A0ABP6UTG1_9FLAO
MSTIQNKRILAIDFGRGLSVIAMILVHTLWIHASQEIQENTFLGHFIHFVGRGTPIFLITMGISFMISSKQTLASGLLRGLMILGVAYLMNFFKFIFPILIGLMPVSFIEAYGWTAPVSLENYTYLLLTGDILQLAGVSLIIISLIRAYIKNKYIYLIIALIIAAVSREFTEIQTGIYILDYIAQLLWSTGYWVYFPVFPWISFIILGMFFGKWYVEKNRDQDMMFKKMALFGFIFMIVGAVLVFTNEPYHFNDFFHLGPGGVIYLAGWNFVALWLIHLLLKYTNPNKIYQSFYYCSTHVTSLYVLQWVIICWGMAIFGFQSQNELNTLLLMILFLVVTFVVHYASIKIIDTLRKNKKHAVKTKADKSILAKS